MTKGIVMNGLILSLLVAAAVNVCVSQSNPQQDVGKTISWQKDLPPNAKLHEMTPDEMKKYDSEAMAKAEVKTGPIIHADRRGIEAIDPAKLQILQQQKLAVSGMKLHASVPQALTSPSQPGSQTTATVPAVQTASRVSAPPMMKPATQPSAAGGIQAASVPAMRPLLLQAQPGSTPSTLMSAAGGSGGSPSTMGSTATTAVSAPSKSKIASVNNSLSNVTYICQYPVIMEVNHLTKNVVFTPDQTYNTYVIKGCFFGKQPGQIYLVGNFNAPHVSLQEEFWSDNEIDARVDPKTSGEQDQQSVTLIVAPAGAGQIKATGFEFVAARSNPPVLLQAVPKSWLGYSGWTGGAGIEPVNFQSPVNPGNSSPSSMAGNTVYVSRSDNQKFSSGTDYYTPTLAPGWTLDSTQMTTVANPPSCPGVVTYKQTFGFSQADMTPLQPDWTKVPRHGLHVDASDTSCSGFIPIAPPFIFWTYANATGSAYGLKIWAVGPRCTDPYTGLPAAQCMQNMQQCGTETCSN
jgi:hypothetical protein